MDFWCVSSNIAMLSIDLIPQYILVCRLSNMTPSPYSNFLKFYSFCSVCTVTVVVVVVVFSSEVLREHRRKCQQDKDLLPYVAIIHVRDMLIMPSERCVCVCVCVCVCMHVASLSWCAGVASSTCGKGQFSG